MAGLGSGSTREELAGRGTGQGDVDYSLGGGNLNIDYNQYQEPVGPEAPLQGPPSPDGQQYNYYDEAAAQAAAAEEARRRAEEERRRLEREQNERQHRENDERNREAELARQQEGDANRRTQETHSTVASTDTQVRPEETRAESSAQPASTMRPVSTWDADGNEVVIDESTGNLISGQETEYGQWLTSLTPRERMTFATQSRISQTLNAEEDDVVVDRNQNELEDQERDSDGLTQEDYDRWSAWSFYQGDPDQQELSPWERYEQIASTIGPSINDAIRLDAARQTAERLSGQTYEQYRQQQNQQQNQQQQTTQQQTQQQSQQPDEEESMYQQVENFIQRTSQERIRAAYRANQLERDVWLNANQGMTAEDYELSDEYWEDAEAFNHVLQSMMSEQYKSLGNIQYDADGNIIDPGAGRAFKENPKQAQLIQSVIRSFQIGFFHVGGERIETDPNTGEQTLRWGNPQGSRVEDRIINLCDYFGMDPNMLDSQRTVFRLVTLYASMSVDRNGQMFKEDKGEWSLTEDEFCQICDMILVSCIEHHHPLAPPWRTQVGEGKLRGTYIIPSGVLPKVVAQAITGEHSNLRNAEGNIPSPSELVEMARVTWNNDTYPWMRETLVNEPQRGKPRKDKDGNEIKPRNLMGQRMVIEDMQQALARIDGISAEEFSDHEHGWGVDTTLHYRISEYQDTHKMYAEAVGESFVDAQGVIDYQNEILEAVRNDARQVKSKEYSAIQAGANIVTSGIRTNALFWNVPIIVSAIAEKKVGNIQTDWAIKSIAHRTERITGSEVMRVSDELQDAFATDEAYRSIDAALFLMDIIGPEALVLYASKKPNTPLTPESAAAFVEQEYAGNPKNAAAARARDFQQKLAKFQQTILTGDLFFRKEDAKNFLNAFLTCNQVLRGAQQQLADRGLIDQHAGLAFTGAEIDDAFTACHGNVALFIADMIKTPAGRDALIMMRSNNIGNFNPVGYAINRVLRNHGVSDAVITAVLDSFPKYGINFLYAMTPFSRTLSYLAIKKREASGDPMASLLVMGGSFSDVSNVNTFGEAMQDPMFTAGLRINLMYDAMTIGRWGATMILLGGVMAILGFEPPDDPDDWQNVTRWKIGGLEIQQAYWLNDLTQLGLPLAYGFAATASGHGDKALQLTLNSLYDQLDGNVVMDFIKYVRGWTDEIEKLDMIATDPAYVSGWDPGYALLEMMLSAGDKIVPGAPLYRYIQNDSFLRGANADEKTAYRKFDKSSDWAKGVGKTDYVTDPHERQLRRHCTANWLLATYENIVHGTMPWDDDSNETGFYWWQMPSRPKADDLVLTWSASQEMDYTNREGCKTDEEYKQHKTDFLLSQIDQVSEEYGGLEQAIMNGYFIKHDIRYAALEVLSERAAQEDLQFQEKIDSGELKLYSSEFYSEKEAKDARVSKIWKYIHIMQDKDIPMWYEGYTQILSNKEIDYFHEDGTSASPWEWFFNINGPITKEYRNKGDHPWFLAPITWADMQSNELIKKGFSGETLPFWYAEGENGGTNVEAIMNGIGKETVPMGVNAGRILNDVLFNQTTSGDYLHPDKPTIDDRAWKPVKGYLSDDIANFDAAARIKEMIDKDEKGDDKDDKKKTTYPKSFGGSGYRRSGGSYRKSSYEYNPKIYSIRAQNTHVSGTHTNSTRTNPNTYSVNTDRAATMYSKQPQSAKGTYLRPNFETKGSREAYKRSDI